MYLYKTWWKSYPGLISQINLNELFIFGFCVCQLVNFFTEKGKNCIIFSIFKISLSKWVDIFSSAYKTDCLTKLDFSTMCLSVGSLKIFIDTFVHWRSCSPLVLFNSSLMEYHKLLEWRLHNSFDWYHKFCNDL